MTMFGSVLIFIVIVFKSFSFKTLIMRRQMTRYGKTRGYGCAKQSYLNSPQPTSGRKITNKLQTLLLPRCGYWIRDVEAHLVCACVYMFNSVSIMYKYIMTVGYPDHFLWCEKILWTRFNNGINRKSLLKSLLTYQTCLSLKFLNFIYFTTTENAFYLCNGQKSLINDCN